MSSWGAVLPVLDAAAKTLLSLRLPDPFRLDLHVATSPGVVQFTYDKLCLPNSKQRVLPGTGHGSMRCPLAGCLGVRPAGYMQKSATGAMANLVDRFQPSQDANNIMV